MFNSTNKENQILHKANGEKKADRSNASLPKFSILKNNNNVYFHDK